MVSVRLEILAMQLLEDFRAKAPRVKLQQFYCEPLATTDIEAYGFYDSVPFQK